LNLSPDPLPLFSITSAPCFPRGLALGSGADGWTAHPRLYGRLLSTPYKLLPSYCRLFPPFRLVVQKRRAECPQALLSLTHSDPRHVEGRDCFSPPFIHFSFSVNRLCNKGTSLAFDHTTPLAPLYTRSLRSSVPCSKPSPPCSFSAGRFADSRRI